MTQTLIIIYMTLCISIGLFNLVYIILNNTENAFDLFKSKLIIDIQNVSDINDDYFLRHLKNIKVLTKFESFLKENNNNYNFSEYFQNKTDLLYKLLCYYKKKNDTYFIYLVNILSNYNFISDDIINLFYKCLLDKNIYLRYEVLSFICKNGNPKYILESLKIICKNNVYFDKRIIVENLILCENKSLAKKLLGFFDNFCENIKLAILDYLRINKISAKKEALNILNGNYSDEVKYSAIRYFGKVKNDDAKDVLINLAKNGDVNYKVVSSKALSNYNDEKVISILKKNSKSDNFYIRINAIESLSKILSNEDFAKAISKTDKFQKEEMLYYLDKKRG